MINDNQDANDVHMYSEWIHAVVDLGGGGGGGYGGQLPPPPFFFASIFTGGVCSFSHSIYNS